MSLVRRLKFGSLLVALATSACTSFGASAPSDSLGTDSDRISNDAGSLVSNNTGSLTGVFRAPQTLVSNNTGSYRIGSLAEKPVAGATVTAYDLSGNLVTGSEAETGADGRFALAVPPNRPLVLRASLTSSGRSYVFQTVGVSEDRATGSADLTAGTTLAADSLLRIAAQKGLDMRTLVKTRLAELSTLLGGVFASDRIGVLSEGQAALLDYTNSLMADHSDLRYLAAVLNGYTGLAYFEGALHLADNTRGMLLRRKDDGSFASWLGGSDGRFAEGPAASARFASVYGMVRASDGTIYFADAGNHRIRRVSPSGEVSTFAGGSAGSSDGTGEAAQFRFPTSVALSGAALFVTDTGNNLIRRIDLASGGVTTVAGSTTASGSGDGPGTSLRLSTPRSIVADAGGTLYFIESSISEIRRLGANSDGTYQVETFAGGQFNNIEQYSILDGRGREAAFFLPMAMAYHDQALYVADTMSHAVRRVDLASPDRTVTTVAGGGPNFPGKNDGSGWAARFRGPDSLAVAADGTLFVGDGGNLALRQITGSSVTTLPVSVAAE